MDIPKSHPRYRSLVEREKIVDGFKRGIVVAQGLLAHGRGEAFDYLIGEQTQEFALKAIEAAAALLLVSEKPVISVNGNAAALVPEYLVMLSNELGAPLEVNLFYRTREREVAIYEWLRAHGATSVLGVYDERIELEGLESNRRIVSKNGIYAADTVFVPLEDGDRTEALRRAGKRVITIDLNPLSRTARAANITIVDNITRAVPLLVSKVREFADYNVEQLKDILNKYDNEETLSEALEFISNRLENLAREGVSLQF